MEDGRYLIFYTFDEEAARAGEDRGRSASSAMTASRRAEETAANEAAMNEATNDDARVEGSAVEERRV